MTIAHAGLLPFLVTFLVGFLVQVFRTFIVLFMQFVQNKLLHLTIVCSTPDPASNTYYVLHNSQHIAFIYYAFLTWWPLKALCNVCIPLTHSYTHPYADGDVWMNHAREHRWQLVQEQFESSSGTPRHSESRGQHRHSWICMHLSPGGCVHLWMGNMQSPVCVRQHVGVALIAVLCLVLSSNFSLYSEVQSAAREIGQLIVTSTLILLTLYCIISHQSQACI